MAESGNWLSRKIVGLGKGSKLDQDTQDRVALVNALANQVEMPAATSMKQLATGDDLVNFYKAALFNEAQPQDVSFGGQVIGFEPSTGQGQLPAGYPGDLYMQMQKHSPRYKPFLRK